jgi:hypothetical protein
VNTSGGVAKIWDGSVWNLVAPKVWNGTTWVTAQVRVWTGTWEYANTTSTEYGPYSYAGSNAFRVGYGSWSGWSAVTSGSVSTTGTISFLVQNLYAVTGDSQVLGYSFNNATVSGGSSSTFTNTNGAGGTYLVATRTVTHTYTTSGTNPGNFSGTLTGSGFYNGSTPTHFFSIPIPVRPV